MAKQYFENNVSATLVRNASSTDTVLYFDDVSMFPNVTSGDFFLLTIFSSASLGVESNWEVVKVTAVNYSDKTVTCQRGYEIGASVHVAGELAQMRTTARTLNVLRDSIGAISGENGADLVGIGGGRTQADKNSENISVRDFGAVGDGIVNDTADIQSAIEAVDGVPAKLNAGVYLSDLDLIAGTGLYGDSQKGSVLKRNGGGAALSVTATDGFSLNNCTVDNDFTATGISGHAVILLDSDKFQVENVEINNFGNPGGTAGSGFLAYSSTSSADPVKLGFSSNLKIVGAAIGLSSDTNGYLLVDGRYCIAHATYAESINAYALEFKNDTRYSIMSDSIANKAAYGIGLGQTTVGIDGCDFNAFSNIITTACDFGIYAGEATYNSFSNIICDTTNSPGVALGGKFHARFDSNSHGNSIWGMTTFGASSAAIRWGGANNYASIANHGSPTSLLELESGASRNVLYVASPGPTDSSILSRISDSSGFSPQGSTGNVVFSPGTGEHYGSLSGHYHWKLSDAGIIAPAATDHAVFESAASTGYLTMMGPGGDSSSRGFAVRTAYKGGYHGTLDLVQGSNAAGDYWGFTLNGAGLVRMFSSTMRAVTDNVMTLGTAAVRWASVFANQFRPGNGTAIWTSGSGSPEGVLTAPVGSLYTRTDGGASTTLYVKESGAGNTGWVAK